MLSRTVEAVLPARGRRPSASLSPAAIAAWRWRLRAIATEWIRRWAWRQDERALVDDLEAVGWIVLLERGPADPRIRLKIEDAMKDAIARWLWGVGRGKRDRILHLQCPLEAAAGVTTADHLVPSLVAWRQMILLLRQRLPADLAWVFDQLAAGAANGTARPYEIPRAAREARGWTHKQLHRRRAKLRALVRAAVGEEP